MSKRDRSKEFAASGPTEYSGRAVPLVVIESRVADVWKGVLGVPVAGFEENFFEAGGTSLLATILLTRLNQAFALKIPIAMVFDHPTVRSMSAHIAGILTDPDKANKKTNLDSAACAKLDHAVELQSAKTADSSAVAIIGMTGRFPGASSVEQFWRNLCDGVESITWFNQEDLDGRERHGKLPDDYVAARPILDAPELFDAEFFGIYPKEAELMDPQHRIFLECAWEVMERAGYDPTKTTEQVGVFAGSSMNTYLMHNLAGSRRFLEDFTGAYQVGSYVTMMGNDKDFLPTRVSYKLNLHGPSVAVQSACSTSLVAVCQACQTLVTGGCDMALAGAVSITFPQRRGYIPHEGGIVSSDGHCRPFDHKASGTIFGSGAAVLLLKRLEDAVADGDQLLGVIRGFAINNDGANKVGYTAPGVDGQSQVIQRALKVAGVSADSISYVEAHGTGTPLGDPIEVAALSKAFGRSSDRRQVCAIGTAKANVGHLDVASGATGLIKTVLQLEHKTIPKQLHFEKPNPHLHLDETPFFVAQRNMDWKSDDGPLRAGVSAFGIGGTNAHVIVEEAPQVDESDAGRSLQLLVWSAKTEPALNELTANLVRQISENPGQNLADIAYTLQIGRTSHRHRRMAVAGSLDEVAKIITGLQTTSPSSTQSPLESPGVVFCFPGQGVQKLQMGRELYETESAFRDALNLCSEKLQPVLGMSLIELLYPAIETPDASARLNETKYAQPAIFAVEYALAQLWLSWGIKPDAMVGHSVGEFVAVCLSGGISLDDALRVVAERGRLMQTMPSGAMLAVRAPEEKVLACMAAIPDQPLDLAAVNGPQLCVVSGPDAAIDAFADVLDKQKIAHRPLQTSHAFHSKMMDAALDPFKELLKDVRFGKMSVPCVSTLTGEWLTEEDIANSDYWTRQLRQTVRFADAVQTLAKMPDRVFLEVGPSETLVQPIRQTLKSASNSATASAQHATSDKERRVSKPHIVVASLESGADGASVTRGMLTALGRLWTAGVQPDWRAFHTGFRRKRVLLPTYPFQRKSYWIAPPEDSETVNAASDIPDELVQHRNIEDSIMAETSAVDSSANKTATLNEVQLLIADLSGIDLATADPESSFLELGFDSLFLTQLTQAIQSKYRVKLTFRQIMESYPTIASLSSHVDATAAPELLVRAAVEPVAQTSSNSTASLFASSPVQPFSPVAPIAPPLQLSAGGHESLFTAQMHALTSLFQQQLAVLGAQGAATAMPLVPTQAAIAPVVQSSSSISTEKALSKPVFVPFKPLQRGEHAGLSTEQQEYLGSFITDYNRRTAGSKKFTQDNRSVFADGRVVSGFHAQLKEMVYPLVVERAKGAYLWDKDGNRYIDILNGYGAILYGHSPDFLVEAVHKQLDLGFAIGPQTELVGECSELIRELTGMERVTFCNTGSEAVMGAMRLARTVTGRNLIVVFSGDYHGSFDEVLVKAVGGHRTMPAAPGIPRESVANMLVLDYGTDESLEIIRSRAHELAAVMVEPVQSRHPNLRPQEFLKKVREITEQNGTALIFDEVVTGFRTHPGGMQAVYGIRADLATYGKVVAGGLPVGVLAGTPAFMDALDGGAWQFGDNSFPEVGVTFYAGTFMRHPLAMAAVRASLLHIKENGIALQNKLAARTTKLAESITGMFSEFSHPSSLESYSSWLYFSVATEPLLARLLHFHLRNQGIHIQEGFPCFLTTAHTDADLDFVRDAFYASLKQMHSVQALGQSVPVPALAASSHVTVMSEVVDASDASTKACCEVLEFPITEPQREILLGAEMGDEANCAFNESVSLDLEGELNEAALLGGLQQLVDRHQALRLNFDKAREVAIIDPRLEVKTERDDLSELSAAERKAKLAAITSQESTTSFDLGYGPLFRVRLIRLAALQHILLFTAHHIIFDGWSTNVFFSELSELYNAAVQGREAALPTVHSFSDYAALEQKKANSAERQETREFWLGQFKTMPMPLQLPTDRPREAMRSYDGATASYELDSELFAAVRKAGARQGNTLFATLLSAFSLMIHRLADKDDVVIGIPMAGQSRVENGAALVGHCVNFLPMRSFLQAKQSLTEFMKHTRKTLLDAYDHQNYTYGELLHQLRTDGNAERPSLIEIQANVEQVGSNLEFSKLKVDLRANGKKFVNMDLFFNFIDRGSDLRLDVDYNISLFDKETIDRWFGHLQTLLHNFVADAKQDSAEISLLSKEQEGEMIAQWNQTATEYLVNSSIHQCFERQVQITPAKVAVVSNDQTLTYGELNEKANQLARFLLRSGVTSGSRVGLCMPRSLETIVSLLAIVKTGAAYVPIDATYPAARLQFLVKDSGCNVILTQQTIAKTLPKLDATLLWVDQDWPAVALENSHNLSQESTKNDLAYVMYTSGSTGNPKGVLIPHQAVLRLVKNNHYASFSADEVFLQLAPLSFDASTFEIWGALLNGGRLILGPADRVTPEDIGLLINEHKVSTLWLTAALFHLMVTEHLELLRPLRQLLAGGDVLSLTHVRSVCEKLPNLRLINGYGPTENTTFTCCHTITRSSLNAGTVPIGRPIANTRIYILDAKRKPVPVGVSGELYAAGDGLALGYLNAPEQTAEKFITHTFTNGLTERMYRTGDMARYRADGTVEFLGRIDTQVKIRGYRVELAEIEYALEQSQKVKSAVVSVRTDWTTPNDLPGDKRLVAYVVLADSRDSAAVVRELRQHLQESLPDYMRPAAIMVLDSLPRTSNGKVDRRALPAPLPEQQLHARALVSPRTSEEEKLAAIWSKLLGVSEVSVEDSIFELGGDSLLIFRITTHAQQAGLNINARQIFQFRTISAICAQLGQPDENGTAQTKKASIQAVSRKQYRRTLTTLETAGN